MQAPLRFLVVATDTLNTVPLYIDAGTVIPPRLFLAEAEKPSLPRNRKERREIRYGRAQAWKRRE